MSMNRQERRRAQRAAAKAAGRTAVAPPMAGPLQRARELADSGDLAAAEELLRERVGAEPKDTAALVLLSHVLLRGEHYDEAVACARRAAVRDARSADAQTALGEALRQQDRVVESLQCHERATTLAPENAEARHAYGLALIDAGEAAAAAEQLRRACALAPGSVRYITTLATALARLNAYDEALRIFNQAVEAVPGNAQLLFNRSFCHLATGHLPEGWDDFEYGFAAHGRKPDRTFDVPAWDGAGLPPGRRVLIWREQGIGDELRLGSCYRDVIERTTDVIIETEPRLVGLLRRSFPTAIVRPPTSDDQGRSTRAAADYAAHIPAGSLPRLFRRRLDDFPEQGAYLVADPDRTDEFRRRLEALGPGLKVGICWRSMKLDVKRLQWYTTLEEWDPVLGVAGATFVNLQYGDRDLLTTELTANAQRTGVEVATFDDLDYTNDLEGVASLITALDLVVGVSTSVSLLTGALGRPGLQLGLVGDPMQFGLRDRYPWFPTIQPVDRPHGETWAPVMQRVAARVAEMASAP